MKRLITSMLIVLLLCVAFIGSFYKGYYSYAEDIDFMSDKELEAAYQAYLQSKGGGLLGNAGARLAYTNGKMLNFLTSEYNTTPYKNINQVKGLLSWEKAELESGNSSVLQLTMRHPEVFSLYTQWLLQEKYLGNGITETDGIFNDGVDNTIYSGDYFTDADGYSSLVYYVTNPTYYSSTGAYGFTTSNLTVGSPYRYNSIQLYDNYNNGINYYTFHLTSSITYNLSIAGLSQGNLIYMIYSGKANNSRTFYRIEPATGSCFIWGVPAIVKNVSNDKYYFARIGCASNSFDDNILGQFGDYPNNGCSFYPFSEITNDVSDVTQVVNLNFYTNQNNNIINYPDINADGTLYITPKVKVGVDYQPYTINEGDTIQNVVNNYYNDSGEKDKTITVPSTTPDSGSGGGASSGGTTPNWNNPYPNLSPDGNGGFNFNFTLPDLNIDWNINGLSEKFPFSIPFDLIRFVSILNAEPETPHFEGTVNLIVYEWNIDADLSDFDNLAGIVRNVEFIGFCITLILITRRMIKG